MTDGLRRLNARAHATLALAAVGVSLLFSAAASAMTCGAATSEGVLVAQGDSMYVKFRVSPAPPPLGDLFVVDAKTCSSTHQPLDGVLSADAIMPAHGHGMNYAVEAAPTVDGSARLQGFLWQMPGLWRVRFRLKTDGATYRSAYDYKFAPH